MVTSRTGTRPFRRWRGNVFSSRNVGKMVISGTVSLPFRRKRENAFSSSETSKNGHMANGNQAISPMARKHFSGPETSEKIVISGTVSLPLRRRRENAFSSSETSKNCHFANGNPADSPVATKHVCRSRNVGKNCHFSNGKPAVSPEARKRFFKLRNVQKWSLRERESGRFVRGDETL